MLILITYFAIGLVQDVLGVIDFKATQHNKAGLASVIGFISEYAGYIVFYFIISAPGVLEGDNWERALVELGVYCLGGAIGNYSTMKFFKKWRSGVKS